mgnify:FL=1
MDYKKEMEQVEISGKYLSLPEGAHKLLVLDELSEERKNDYKGAVTTVRDLTVEFQGQEKVWRLKLGGKNSNYGRIVAIGAKHGKLKGVYLNVTRQGLTKADTRYTIFDGGRQEEKLAVGQPSPSEQVKTDAKEFM